MEDFELSIYCSNFLQDKSLGDLVFYKDKNQHFTYKDLMHSVLSQMENNTVSFSALKIKSSYQLFIHLLAGSMTKKDLLILSDKAPAAAISDYQKRLHFEDIITDTEVLEKNYLDFSNTSVDMNRAAFFILSSGSSGPTKSIGLSLNNVYHSAKSVIDFFHITSSDCTFLNLPHHHIGGLMILWRAFFSQSSVTVNEDDHFQFISLVPLQLKRFLQHPNQLKKLQDCRGVLIGGALLSEHLKAEAKSKNVLLYETYGMSETSSLVMLNGVALKGQTVKLDSKNNFMIKGSTLSSQVTLDADGFYHTKDLGVLNSDGTFSFKQRSDLLFKSAGELIDPLSIEEIIKQHLPWITMAIIVPITHAEWNYAGCLIYQSNDPSKSHEDIKGHLKKLLHPHHIPRYFYEAPIDLVSDGMKPKRYDISKWAQESYFKSILHYRYIPGNHTEKLIVFFHGFMEDHADMLPLMDSKGGASFLFIDIPGHGKTNSNSFDKRSDVFSSIANLIEFYQNDSELVLYGYSMGGRIALELAALYLKPQLLILESAHFGLETQALKQERLNSDNKLFSEVNLNLNQFFTKWYSNPIFANYNQSPHYLKDIKKKIHFDFLQWQHSLTYFSPGISPMLQSEMLNKVRVLKIIGITGRNDLKYSDHYKNIKNTLPYFTHIEIEQAGHNPHKTHPNELNSILRPILYKTSI